MNEGIYSEEFKNKLQDLYIEYDLTRIKIEHPRARQDWKVTKERGFHLASNKVTATSGSRSATIEVLEGDDPYELYEVASKQVKEKVAIANKQWREANKGRANRRQVAAQRRYRSRIAEEKRTVQQHGQ